MSDLARAVETVVGQCLAVKEQENVVVVADTGTRRIGDALRDAAAARGAEAVLAVMDPRPVDGFEPPPAIAAALAAAHVFIAPTTKSLSHTRARKTATDNGARGATLPGVTEDMLARLLACDFDLMARRSRAVAELLTQAGEAHLTCPRGSDIRFDLTGRMAIADDGDLTAPKAFGNLPCGEGFIAPRTAEGSFQTVCIAGIGLIEDDPATLTVEGGMLTQATGAAGERLLELLREAGPEGPTIAELGVGTNEQARLTGNILEDEKMLGTVHIAFGASAGIGGTVSVPIHLDCLVVDPTLDIGGTRVVEQGRFVLEA